VAKRSKRPPSPSAKPSAKPSANVTGVVYGAFGVLVFAFIAYSSVQVISVCFDLRPSEKPLPPSCAAGIRTMLNALDRAAAGDPERFEKALSPEWDARADVESRCAVDADAIEVYAETLRLERELAGRASLDARQTRALRKSLERRLEPR